MVEECAAPTKTGTSDFPSSSILQGVLCSSLNPGISNEIPHHQIISVLLMHANQCIINTSIRSKITSFLPYITPLIKNVALSFARTTNHFFLVRCTVKACLKQRRNSLVLICAIASQSILQKLEPT